VEGKQLNPDWLRIRQGDSIQIFNPGGSTVSVYFPSSPTTLQVRSEAKASVTFSQVGIHQAL